jgi:acetylornithine deacetylase/succinyl-diaminopimelate desuccinylase-like protein
MDQKLLTTIQHQHDQAIADLIRFVAQPSISAQNVGMVEAVRLTAEMLAGAGFQVQILPTDGPYPVIFGHQRGASENTLLFYDHYDVQPPEPLNLWDSPPFEPTIREDKLYGRGVSDNKANIVSRLAAIRALREVYGTLPVSVKFVIEGEEEVGSPNLPAFVERHRDLLAADACIWESGGVDWDGAPQVVLGLKGILYVTLRVTSMARDAHSSTGTHLPNAAWRLVWAIASLKGVDERIQIDGFYDAVRPPTAAELAAADAMPYDEAKTRQSFQIERFLLNLEGASLRRRVLFEPVLNVCGLSAGYEGPGSKTVLPSEAMAKLDFRLVPDQRPEDILNKLRAHLDRHGFADVIVDPEDHGENPARTPLDHPFARLVADAALDVYGKPAAMIPTMAGSGPMYSFAATLGLPVASAGAGYPDSRAHAPNENIRLADFANAVKHVAAIIQRMASETPG